MCTVFSDRRPRAGPPTTLQCARGRTPDRQLGRIQPVAVRVTDACPGRRAAGPIVSAAARGGGGGSCPAAAIRSHILNISTNISY